MTQNQSLFNQQNAAIRNLETQVSQLALNQNSRALGTLPSNTEVPRDLEKEHVKVMTLRSGKELTETIPKESEQVVSKPETIPMVPVTESPPKPLDDQPPETTTFVPPKSDYPLLFPEKVARKKPIEDEVITGPKTKDEISSEPQESKTKTLGTLDPSCSTQPDKAIIKLVHLYVPFPQKLRNQKEELQFKKFLEVFKALHINIPLVEAIAKMPSYAKFLKDILSKKKKLTEYETVALTEGCSALLTNKILPKLKDPGSFTIPCSIGGKEIGKALCDLGASINLMPLSVFNTLGIGEARPTTVTLQLANRTIAYPKGMIEDVLVQVDKFIFPADFIILDFEADKDIPIILGRPFLATGGTLIDVQKEKLTMRLQDQKVAFNIFNSLKYPDYLEECLGVTEIETLCYEEGVRKACKLEEEEGAEIGDDIVEDLEGDVPSDAAAFELLDNSELKNFTPSIISPPVLELKQLPSHLKYAFLGEEEFDLEIVDRKGVDNQVADHLSRLEKPRESLEEGEIVETFPDERILVLESKPPWFADIANYLACGIRPSDISGHMFKKFLHDTKTYLWDDPYLFKISVDQILRRCIPETEVVAIMQHCHQAAYGGYFRGQRTTAKVLQSGFYWPTLFKYAHNFAQRCNECQRSGSISKRNEMPLNGILEVELFDV
ncbi:uncharacterized protein LOC112517738 [Cynara cardunculus var. scolymus]|uniref:uncharacterized protein LOC112517738 n=1 Tax=Cynara cardunculus var. scolymus TaxID=59895 RepID=UPI000D627AAE|nr:uncharacterized protein LOC112517738 [Cynara cardunculus var. scolymus]